MFGLKYFFWLTGHFLPLLTWFKCSRRDIFIIPAPVSQARRGLHFFSPGSYKTQASPGFSHKTTGATSKSGNIMTSRGQTKAFPLAALSSHTK
jgi:hypothetical protein